jgi:hypothetical protein
LREKVGDRKIIEGLLPKKDDGVYYDELEWKAKMTEGPK